MARTAGKYKAAAGVNTAFRHECRHTGWDDDGFGMRLRVEREEQVLEKEKVEGPKYSCASSGLRLGRPGIAPGWLSPRGWNPVPKKK
jgi:hypothetical protein